MSHPAVQSAPERPSGRGQGLREGMLRDGMRTLLHGVALEQLYLALVHDLAHADAEDLHIVVLRIDAGLLQRQTANFITD